MESIGCLHERSKSLDNRIGKSPMHFNIPGQTKSPAHRRTDLKSDYCVSIRRNALSVTKARESTLCVRSYNPEKPAGVRRSSSPAYMVAQRARKVDRESPTGVT